MKKEKIVAMMPVKNESGWILALDADEMFEDRIIDEAKLLINQTDYDAIYFRLFDFWGSRTHYRTDNGWNPWQRFALFLVRSRPDLDSTWFPRGVHCGRFPVSCQELIPYFSDIRVKHFGWAREEEHYRKYLYYREKDLKLYGEVRPFTQSIQAPRGKIRLEEWKDTKTLYFLKDGEERNADNFIFTLL